MLSERIEKLVNIFSNFPTIGRRTAVRFVFYLLKLPHEKIEEIAQAILTLKKNVKICPLCFNPFEPSSAEQNSCSICSDKTRNKSIICIIEKEVDFQAIEKTKKYKGLYFILGGVISALRQKESKSLLEKRVEALITRVKQEKKHPIKEIILALNPTPEGEITSLWLERKFKLLGIKTTRLAIGLPKGGELEYADEDTISSALQERK